MSVEDFDGQDDLQARDDNLRLLGFSDYTEYLASDLWEWIKSRMIEQTGNNFCACCKSRTGLVWHHIYYTLPILVGNFSNHPQPIVRLCQPCHNAIHFSAGRFCTLSESRDRFHQLCEAKGDREILTGIPIGSEFVGNWPSYRKPFEAGK